MIPKYNFIFLCKSSQKSHALLVSCIHSQLLSDSLPSSFQFAYRMFHSIQTTFQHHNDLLLAMVWGEVTSLILLDLSAAFNTVHSIILHYLQNWLVWSSWHFSLMVCILPNLSLLASLYKKFHFTISISVPQGFVFGPLLFTLCTTQ